MFINPDHSVRRPKLQHYLCIITPFGAEQLASVREELESLKESSDRWRADAEAKWRHLKRASESATKDAKTCQQAGDAAKHELTTLKAAFRSFLKTLWDDMKHRPANSAAFRSDDTNHRPAISATFSSATPLPVRAKPLPEKRDTSADGGLDPGRLVPCGTGDDIAMCRAGASAPIPSGFVVVKAKDGKRDLAGAVDAAGDGAKTKGGPFGELTEAEVSDIMQALSGDSYSHSSSDRVETPSVPPPDLLDSAPVTQFLPSFRDAAAMSPPLDREFEEEEAFSARIESALAGHNAPAALADMLRSLHAHNFSEVVVDAVGGEPLVLPQPPPNAQSGLSTIRAEPRAVATQAPGPSNTNVSLERWPRAQTLDHASESLLFSGDGRGDLHSGVLLNYGGNPPSFSALDGAAFTFGGNADSLLVEDLT